VNPIFRRLIAGLCVTGGLGVLYYELAHETGSDRWFWIVIAGLAVVLGIIELLSPGKPRPPIEPPS
jgi:hypothetical protein